MNIKNCPVCQSEQVKWLFESKDFKNTTNKIFSYRKCQHCDLFSIYPRPQPQELLAYYPEDYVPYKEPGKENWSKINKRLHRRHYLIRCRAVNSAIGGGTLLLDIGCGSGNFLVELLRDGNWRAIGIDINPYAVQTATSRGLDIRLGDLMDLEFPTSSFDAVTIWDVLEHVRNPKRTIEEIRRILKPEGYLFLSTPNGNSLQARLWQKYWVGWDIPRHLQVFTYHVLFNMLEDTGFVLKGKFAFPTERYYAVESTRQWIQESCSGSLARFANQITHFIGVLAWPVFWLFDRTPIASNIALKFQLIQ